MKLDLSGFENTTPLVGLTCDLLPEFSTAASFELPNATDVSSKMLSGFDVLLLDNWL